MILPLANARDRETQVIWGIADFRRRFGREPEGMWLPEAAVDTETLEALARHGIRFTILSPQQAARMRRIGESDWEGIRGGRAERRPARVSLPSGRDIAVFFYDGPLSQAIAFGLLGDGPVRLAERFASLFSEGEEPQLVHVATDGETYGHHHRGGEVDSRGGARRDRERRGRAAHQLWGISRDGAADRRGRDRRREFLELPARTQTLARRLCLPDRASPGMESGLASASARSARLAARRARLALRTATRRRSSPISGSARNDWISILLERRPDALEEFLARHAGRSLSEPEKEMAVRLLEIQRLSMRMFTSCGWFFDDPAGLETGIVLRFAGRAIELGGARVRRRSGGTISRAPGARPQQQARARGRKNDLRCGRRAVSRSFRRSADAAARAGEYLGARRRRTRLRTVTRMGTSDDVTQKVNLTERLSFRKAARKSV